MSEDPHRGQNIIIRRRTSHNNVNNLVFYNITFTSTYFYNDNLNNLQITLKVDEVKHLSEIRSKSKVNLTCY